MAHQLPERPARGWISTIREALGMSSRQLGERLGVAQSTVIAMEQSESTDSIRLETLRRAADALHCDLVYVLVPRDGLDVAVESRRAAVATALRSSVERTMDLEAQAPDLGDDAPPQALGDLDRVLWDSDERLGLR